MALSRLPASEFLEGPFTVSETQYDDFGNPIRVTGANDRCTTLDYDDEYEQLPIGETVYRSAGCNDGLVPRIS